VTPERNQASGGINGGKSRKARVAKITWPLALVIPAFVVFVHPQLLGTALYHRDLVSDQEWLVSPHSTLRMQYRRLGCLRSPEAYVLFMQMFGILASGSEPHAMRFHYLSSIHFFEESPILVHNTSRIVCKPVQPAAFGAFLYHLETPCLCQRAHIIVR
jgi:hypothetical protein